jgi:hypothetical protein
MESKKTLGIFLEAREGVEDPMLELYHHKTKPDIL